MRGWAKHGGVCALGAGILGGCLLVTPLDTPPGGQPSAGAPANAGRAGALVQAGGSGGGGNGGRETQSAGQSAGGEAGETPEVQAGAAGEPSNNGGCTSNAECMKRSVNNLPYRCTEGKCVALENTECPYVYDVESAKASDPIYIGAFAPLPPAQPEASSALYPLRLALGELSGDANGGLVMPNGKRRPLVMVVCNNCADGSCSATSVDKATDHLVNDVGVSAVLATLLPGDLRRVFESHADDDVFFLSPVGATSTLESLDDHDLVWTMLGQPSDLAVVYRDLVSELVEPYLRNVRGIGSRPLRVVLLRGTDAFGAELSSLVLSQLVWNGKSATENGSDNYQGFTFDKLSPADVATSILEFIPDLIISTAGEEVTRDDSGVISLVERQWSGPVTMGAPLPFWVLSPFNAADLGPTARLLKVETAGADPEPTKRFIGVTAAGAEDPQLQNEFALNLKDTYSNADPDTGNYYDAFYYLAYAIYAAHENDPRGAAIARGMHRLLDGPAYNVGLADIARITKALKDETSTIALQGTLGPPAFDEQGIHVDPGAIFCLAPSGDGVTVYPNALRYDRASGGFEGTFPCFSGFVP